MKAPTGARAGKQNVAAPRRLPGRVPLVRALSKLGLASRSDARALIAEGRVRVNERTITDPRALVVPEQIRVAIDNDVRRRSPHRVLVFHKPRGVVTSRQDPQGRRTVFDVLGTAGAGVVAIGRLDMASTGLLMFTNDTQLANWLTDPANRIVRRYVVVVRGRVTPEDAGHLEQGVDGGAPAGGERERLAAAHVQIRKASERETHLLVDLVEGKNREIRRMIAAIGHEVTRLHRIAFGNIELGDLTPGAYREMDDEERRTAWPDFANRRQTRR